MWNATYFLLGRESANTATMQQQPVHPMTPNEWDSHVATQGGILAFAVAIACLFGWLVRPGYPKQS